MSRSALVTGLYAWLCLYACAPLPAPENTGGQLPVSGFAMERVGDVTVTDLDSELPHVLARLGFLLSRAESKTGRELYFTTEWKEHAPFDDQIAQGATAARTRLTLVARSTDKGYYALRLYVENILELEGGTWETMPVTKAFSRHARQIGAELRLALVNRLRPF